MRILLAGIIGGIAMFIWTSIAHMALPLGEAGINEIPYESAVLSAMQSNMGDKTGLYIFPGLGVGKNPTREEKNEAMKQTQQRIAANPPGILMQRNRTKIYSSIAAQAFVLVSRAGKGQPTWKLANARVNDHIHADGLICHYCERLRPRADVPATVVVAIKNVISWRQSDPIISIFVRCHTRDFFFSC